MARKKIGANSAPANQTPRSRSGRIGVALGWNEYGKSRVRLMKVTRKGRVHTVREFSVGIALMGDFARVHTHGDNGACLPTDTMKNTVYALGRMHDIGSIEAFAMLLGRHFVSSHAPTYAARVRIQEIAWKRVRTGGREQPHTFLKGSEERGTCDVLVGREEVHVESGIVDLVMLKSTDSAFSGYPKDRYTTLPETRDRIFCTSVNAAWEYAEISDRRGSIDYAKTRDRVREALIRTFSEHKSESVQHTLYAMGTAALRASPAVSEIRLSLPNKHCLLVNLKPFGMTNPNEIFVPTDEPHGLIEAAVRRA